MKLTPHGVRFPRLGERTGGGLAGEEKRGYLIKFPNSKNQAGGIPWEMIQKVARLC